MDGVKEYIVHVPKHLETNQEKIVSFFGEPIIELIRCKDCKYYEETDETIGTCLLTASGAHVKGYCAWAERRGEE